MWWGGWYGCDDLGDTDVTISISWDRWYRCDDPGDTDVTIWMIQMWRSGRYECDDLGDTESNHEVMSWGHFCVHHYLANNGRGREYSGLWKLSANKRQHFGAGWESEFWSWVGNLNFGAGWESEGHVEILELGGNLDFGAGWESESRVIINSDWCQAFLRF